MIVAVDTGGTKTLVAIFSLSGELLKSEKFPTPRDFNEYVSVTTDAVTRLAGSNTIDAMAIAVPGDIRDGIAKICPNIGWQNVNVHQAFAANFPGIKIVTGNDAAIGAIGESRAIIPVPRLAIYVTISTGIGTGIVARGKLIPEIQRFEGGKVMLPIDGNLISWEKLTSGKSIYEKHQTFAKDITNDKTWQEIATNISYGIMNLIATYEPDYLIIGGSIGTHFDKYGHHLQAIINQEIPAYAQATTIVQATHPEEAVIYGCYQYAHDQIAY